jgi:uncharacterized protein (TIGR03435 family)
MMTLIASHLWQSTIVAALAALLTLAFRDNRAQVRHGLWVAASVKFLIPFAALIAAGRALGWRLLPAVPARQLTIVMQIVGEPISRTVSLASARSASLAETGATSKFMTMAPVILLALWIVGSTALLIAWLARWRRVSRGVRGAACLEDGREFVILRRLEQEHRVRRPVPLMLADSRMEPGVFGILRPRLVWPRAISECLDDRQIEAVIAHELSHVRRRDNLVALVHMLVQALFWFHPLVWWIGARLVDERERACDEDVLRRGSEPEVYAESILKTCQFFIESPLACVAGVTGAGLKRRIETIMTHRGADAMGVAKRMLLSVSALAAIIAPVAVGVLDAPRVRAQSDALRIGEQKFEVASVKPNKTAPPPSRIALQPGGRITVVNMPLRALIRFAFQVQEFQIVGGPDWIASDRFDINAKAENDIAPSPIGEIGAGQLMMRSLLADRFKLSVHQEKREIPIYTLTLARTDGRLGPQLQHSTMDCAALMAAARGRGGPGPVGRGLSPNERPQCGMRMTPGVLSGGGFPVSQLATTLSQFVQRAVVDKTGLTGDFDLDLKWTPEQMPAFTPPPGAPPLPPIDPNGPSIFTAVQEQLGLKLESTKAPVDVLVIDHAELPTPD